VFVYPTTADEVHWPRQPHRSSGRWLLTLLFVGIAPDFSPASDALAGVEWTSRRKLLSNGLLSTREAISGPREAIGLSRNRVSRALQSGRTVTQFDRTAAQSSSTTGTSGRKVAQFDRVVAQRHLQTVTKRSCCRAIRSPRRAGPLATMTKPAWYSAIPSHFRSIEQDSPNERVDQSFTAPVRRGKTLTSRGQEVRGQVANFPRGESSSWEAKNCP